MYITIIHPKKTNGNLKFFNALKTVQGIESSKSIDISLPS